MLSKLSLVLFCFAGLWAVPSLAFGVPSTRAPLTSRVAFSGKNPSVMGSVVLRSTAAGNQPEEEKELNLDTVAELIDTTFVNACMELAQGYVDVLKLFIVSTKSGYEVGVAPLDLIQMVDAVKDKAAGRELMEEEIRLRNTWIQVVYVVLSNAGHLTVDKGVTDAIDESIVAAYTSKIPTLKQRQENGEDFRADDLVDTDAVGGNPLDSVIMAQSLRVIWLTLVVMEEEERCNTEFARQDAPMRPQIPGAFSD